MLRDFLSAISQKKFFLMFFTSVIYIFGLCAYYSGTQFLLASIFLALGVFVIFKNYLSPKLVIFWYFVFFFAFFNVSLRTKSFDALSNFAPKDAIIKGQVVSIPQGANENKTKFFFDVNEITFAKKTEKVNAKTLVMLYSKDNLSRTPNLGDFYEIRGELRIPFASTNPSQFDYGKYLKNFDVFTVFYSDYTGLRKIEAPLSPKWKVLQGINDLRNEIIDIHSKHLKSPNLEILGGIVFGDDAVAPPEYIKKSFINSGLLHILAASGMNVALIYGICFFILRRLKVPFNISVSIGIFVIIFYAIMAGLGPSVIRAAFMLIFILLGKLIDRDAHSISLLSFVALLMLIYNPAYINNLGFQLSFLVTFGLLTMAPAIFERVDSAKADNQKIHIPAWISGAILIPVIAQIWVVPIQMYYFNSFSLYSVFANIAILPFVTVISFGGFISSVLALFKPFANQVCLIFDFLLNPFLTSLVGISDYFSKLPSALLQTPQPSGFQILLYYLIVLLMILIFKIGKNKKLITVAGLSFVILTASFIYSNFASGKLETIVFDVQNADSILLKTPKNKYFLIDSGKMSYSGGRTQASVVVLEYLKDRGVKSIDGLIITHFDSDHAGGAVDLIKKLDIKNVYVNSLSDKSALAQKIYEAAKGKISLAKNSEVIYKEDDVEIKNFVCNIDGDNYENENSIVTLVSNKRFSELLMGDAGILAFEHIKKELPAKIDVLKVGHHGARNVVNKELLNRINPDFALISTGLNIYGHPTKSTLRILKDNDVKVLRTDRENAIKVEHFNNKYSVYSYDPGSKKFVVGRL